MGLLKTARLLRPLVCGVTAVAAAGCGSGPTTPKDPEVSSLQISCPASMLVGQNRFCFANASFVDGSTRNNVAAAWSTNDPAIATITVLANAGSLVGRGQGQAIVSSVFGGKTTVASVSVTAGDFLELTSAGFQGTFVVGRTVTMYGIGHYGVASAGSGQLSIEITDQNDRLVAATPRTVAKGGDAYDLSSTFVIPVGTTRVCRTIVLQIGTTRLTAVGSDGLVPCLNVG